MIPQGRCRLVIVVLEDRSARRPGSRGGAGTSRGRTGSGCRPARSHRGVPGARQVQSLGEAVAFIAAVAVEVRDDRNRAGVRARSRRRRDDCPGPGAPRRVGPVEGRIDRKQMGQVVTPFIHEAVDPLHSHRNIYLSLNGEGGVVEGRRMADRAVAPDGRGRQTGGKICWRNWRTASS